MQSVNFNGYYYFFFRGDVECVKGLDELKVGAMLLNDGASRKGLS